VKTKSLRYFIVTFAIVMCVSAAYAQKPSNSSGIEVKDDEFSNKRKVTLKEQQIAPNLKLTITTTVKMSGPRDIADLDFAQLEFISTTGEREYDSSDNEVNFMVDGKRIRGGPAKSSPLTDKLAQDGRELVIGVIYISSLEQIAHGSEVKMKLGENVFTLDETTKRNIKEFVRALGR
jgi:hypothetical protein